MQKSTKLIVFDLDGTLNQTHLFSVECHNIALKEFGLAPKTCEEICATYGMRANEAVCSNASYRYISLVLKELKLIEFIDFIQPLGKNQTKVDTLRVLLRHTNPDKAIMVGDTSLDYIAGRENGLKTVGCRYGYRPHEAEQADFCINSPLELKTLLPQLF